jgi:hypothetical protein
MELCIANINVRDIKIVMRVVAGAISHIAAGIRFLLVNEKRCTRVGID